MTGTVQAVLVAAAVLYELAGLWIGIPLAWRVRKRKIRLHVAPIISPGLLMTMAWLVAWPLLLKDLRELAEPSS